MRTLFVSMLLCAGVASAHTVQVLGWSKDSEGFAYVESGQRVVIRLAHSWDELRFSITRANPDGSLEGAQVELTKWLADHPLAPAKSSRTSPDGKSQAELALTGVEPGLWSSGTWHRTSDPQFTFKVTREGKTSVSAAGRLGQSVEAYWSPDSRRVAWVSRVPETPDDVASDSVALGTDGSCRAIVWAQQEHVKRVEALGCVVVDFRPDRTSVEDAKDTRTESSAVMFSDERDEAIATKISSGFTEKPRVMKGFFYAADIWVFVVKPKK